MIRSLGLSPFAMAASLEPSASSLITTAFNVGSIKKVGVAMTVRERTDDGVDLNRLFGRDVVVVNLEIVTVTTVSETRCKFSYVS